MEGRGKKAFRWLVSLGALGKLETRLVDLKLSMTCFFFSHSFHVPFLTPLLKRVLIVERPDR